MMLGPGSIAGSKEKSHMGRNYDEVMLGAGSIAGSKEDPRTLEMSEE